MPKFNCSMDYIPISADFIESKMPQANGAYVKVYLLSLSLAYSGADMSNGDIAKKLGLLESDVVNAFEYWSKEGVLRYNDRAVMIGDNAGCGEPVVKKSMEEISEEITSNKSLADLCALSQEILGKTLRNKDIETLYWFYDELGLSPEVITMLLEYCVSKDKRNMNYIERVAISWHENGIVTIDAADKFINAEKEKNSYFYELRKLFGLTERNLSKTEETYLNTWKNDYGMDKSMVALAYEYCIINTGSLSFPYMNSIIKSWNVKGIHTPEAAEKDRESFKGKNRADGESIYGDNGVDYNELEKIMRDKM